MPVHETQRHGESQDLPVWVDRSLFVMENPHVWVSTRWRENMCSHFPPERVFRVRAAHASGQHFERSTRKGFAPLEWGEALELPKARRDGGVPWVSLGNNKAEIAWALPVPDATRGAAACGAGAWKRWLGECRLSAGEVAPRAAAVPVVEA
ncbi:hypothetical protein T492DRAFT_1001820 [Pavlovales sp. CCMP2436]|nr:hypothetical protein T492DRAFT_1001820 [Pavlovales sp. CCMP2436]